MLLLDFINIGYGDAILIREKQSDQTTFAMLVDCGDIEIGDGGELSQRISAVDFLSREGISRLDLLVLTHLHRDHIGGVNGVLSRIPTKELWSTYLPPRTLLDRQAFAEPSFSKTARSTVKTLNILTHALRTAKLQGGTLFEANRSRTLRFTPELEADILCGPEYLYDRQKQALDGLLLGTPDRFELDFSGECTNLTGIRMLLRYHGKSIMLAADVYASYWPELPEPCYLLKAPHHACAESMTETAIAALRPEITIVCVSSDRKDNRPAPNIVALLQQYSGKVLFTDAVALPGMEPSYHSNIQIVIE